MDTSTAKTRCYLDNAKLRISVIHHWSDNHEVIRCGCDDIEGIDSEELTTIVKLWNRKDGQPPVCLSRTLEDIVYWKITETETVKHNTGHV